VTQSGHAACVRCDRKDIAVARLSVNGDRYRIIVDVDQMYLAFGIGPPILITGSLILAVN
jgi:hypothetical protein